MKIQAELRQNVFQVHEPCDVEVQVLCDEDLSPGAVVEIQFPQTWTLVNGPSFTRALQADSPSAPHYVRLHGGTDTEWTHEILPRTQHFPKGQSRHGRVVRITLKNGVVPAEVPLTFHYANTMAPFVAETEELWLRVCGQAPIEAPTLHILPGEERARRVIAPSCARPGEPFSVLIVSLDHFENASSTTYRDEVLTSADGRIMARDIHFTGNIRVPVTLPSEGVFRLRFRDTLSNAIRVSETPCGPYWGDIHIHTKLSHDAQGTDPYGYARNVSGLDFGGVADHVQSLGEVGYEQVLRWAREADRPGEFVTLLADERNPTKLTGHHNMYFRDEETFLAHRYTTGKAPALPEDSGDLDPEKIMLIPHHTGIHFSDISNASRRGGVDWDAYEDKLGMRPALEIYSHHGQSESYAPQHILAYEFNRLRNPERRGNSSAPGPHYAQDWWKRGLRLGAIGSSDEHSGQGGRRRGGIAGVFATELTRENIFDSIRERRCYATTGERILVEFSVGDTAMGQSGSAEPGDTVSIRLAIWGTDLLARAEILRYRFGVDDDFLPLVAQLPNRDAQGLDAEIEIEDTIEGPCMYYARIVQEPLTWPAMAWTSPIWIDTP